MAQTFLPFFFILTTLGDRKLHNLLHYTFRRVWSTTHRHHFCCPTPCCTASISFSSTSLLLQQGLGEEVPSIPIVTSMFAQVLLMLCETVVYGHSSLWRLFVVSRSMRSHIS